MVEPLGSPSPATPLRSDAHSDSYRKREVYRYFRPPAPSATTLSAHQASSPDTTLTALAQLCALRLGAKRAMISVLDGEKQYFIAESTKSLDLADSFKSSEEGDGLWYGCGTVDQKGRLCENTIALPPASVHYKPCFTVKDLTKDPQFCELPFVKGPPHFKFYSGTPLTTKRGFNIGSLFILDVDVRGPLSSDQQSIMGTIASIVMTQMETASEIEDRRKMMRLSHGMNCFVEGKSSLDLEGVLSQTGEIAKNVSTNKTELQTRLNQSISDSETSQDDYEGSRMHQQADTGPRMTLERAANILCDSLDVKDRGGVVFYDATARVRQAAPVSSMEGTGDHGPPRPAEILSSSTSTGAIETSDRNDKADAFKPLEETLLQTLLAKYPRGKMWSFGEDGNLSSSEDDITSPMMRVDSINPRRTKSSRQRVEGLQIQKHFRGVRHLIFTGLWDAGSSRWFAGGFAWTTSVRQIFSQDTDLSYFRAFGNSVMSEVSRVESVAADRQKADFIGSISHEFRSPLHGILASAEFLVDSTLDNFQSNLVDTVSSCGRTLLDTINHILDYSKINSFERNWRVARRPGTRFRKTDKRKLNDKEVPPMMNIYATVNVAAITEEVVEGVYTGQMYQDISSIEATDFPLTAQADVAKRGMSKERPKTLGKAKDVEVIIDIAHDNFVFTTQPGAFKRVVMNIFGNALKYISRGKIVVRLSLDRLIDAAQEGLDDRMLELQISDSGKGISSEYLRTSLFRPFCQEDPLSTGTGLGLSIVKSIVTMLSGTIDVQSEVGKGTEVCIRLPMSRLPGAGTPISTPSSMTTDESCDHFINILQRDFQDTTIALYGFDRGETPEIGAQLCHVLQEYIEEWLGLKVTTQSSHLSIADIVLLDEQSLPSLVEDYHPHISTIILSSNSTRSMVSSRPDGLQHLVSIFVTKPVGPHKLAKAIHVCLSAKAKAVTNGLAPPLFISDEDSPMESDKDTVVPELDNLTLESDRPVSVPMQVQTNGVVTASESDNAQMAIDSSTPLAANEDTKAGKNEEFPFPDLTPDPSSSEEQGSERSQADAKKFALESQRDVLTRQDSRRPPIVSRVTEPLISARSQYMSIASHFNDHKTFVVEAPPSTLAGAKQELRTKPSNLTVSNVAMLNNENTNSPTPQVIQKDQEKRPPRLLLVDDNKINLRLLQTYMRKRQYEFVDSAENGQLAVDAAKAHENGYDIIFMDISMPVMNGFEATRAIRDIEEERAQSHTHTNRQSSALIIALTGLASSRDQAEAFTSGVDLFMTKPVSFKEVGRLLDNWEVHGGVRPVEEEDNREEGEGGWEKG